MKSVRKLKLLLEFHQGFHAPIGFPLSFQDVGPQSLTKPYENVLVHYCFCMVKILNKSSQLVRFY